MRVQEIVTTQTQLRYLVVHENGEPIQPIARYLKYLDCIGRARNTLRAYAYGLRLFFTFLEQKELDYHRLTLDQMADFVLWLKRPYQANNIVPLKPPPQKRANSTINHILTIVAGFYEYYWRLDELEGGLSLSLHIPLPARFRTYKSFLHHLANEKDVEKHVFKQPIYKDRPRTLSRADISLLVAACENRRDHLLLTMLFESSLRIGEALALWIEDIDIARCQIHVRDRGPLDNGAEIKTPASRRSVDISRELINATLDYLAIIHTDEISTNHVFVKLRGPHTGDPLEYADVHDLFTRLKRKTGIDASAHLLRHSSLTLLAKAGWRPEYLQHRAGHSQFQYTYQLYVHPSDEDMRAEWEKTEHQVQWGKEGDKNES
jgi:integrase/recombinase XerD